MSAPKHPARLKAAKKRLRRRPPKRALKAAKEFQAPHNPTMKPKGREG